MAFAESVVDVGPKGRRTTFAVPLGASDCVIGTKSGIVKWRPQDARNEWWVSGGCNMVHAHHWLEIRG